MKPQILWIGFTLGLVACMPPSPVFSGDAPTLSGKIANWTAGKTGFIRIKLNTNAALIGSAVTVSSDGSFNNLPFLSGSVIGTNLASVSDSITGSFCGANANTVIVTPSDAKVAAGLYEILNNTPALAGTVFDATRENIITAPQVGDHLVLRAFTNQNVTIKGNCVLPGAQTRTGTFDVSLKTGWNTLVLEATALSATNVNVSYSATAVPADAQLFFSASGAPL